MEALRPLIQVHTNNVKLLRQDKLTYSCGCKSVRTCKVCLSQGKLDILNRNSNLKPIIHLNNVKDLEPEIIIIQDFLNKIEHDLILENLLFNENINWVNSQSGRKKVDLGPKVNFKKRKIKLSPSFNGFPTFLNLIFEKLKSENVKNKLLCEFIPHEVLFLDYSPDRGSHIDPHIDDPWAWGENLINLNLKSSTTLILENSINRIPIELNPGDLILLRGKPRYEWTHEVLAKDITDHRLCITLRTLSQEVKEKFPEILEKINSFL